jgi:hypothetical protein
MTNSDTAVTIRSEKREEKRKEDSMTQYKKKREKMMLSNAQKT